MKKIIILLMLIILIGCNQSKNSSFDEGYILEVADSRVLILEQKFSDKTWNEILDEYTGRAIWLSTNTNKLKPGQKIRYWIDGEINTSYPEQAKAKKVKVLDE